MIRSVVCSLAFAALMSCGGSAPAPESAKKEAPAVKPADESRRFSSVNQKKIEVVDNHLLGKEFLPGGNLAEYERDGKTYQQFLIDAGSNDKAAFLMSDFKDKLRDPKFVPSFGGYSGYDGNTPIFLFTRSTFLAGIVGLPFDQADLAAREFATRLR